MDVTRYETLRPAFQSGDALVVRTTGLFGAVIRWRTHAPINHVGLLIRLQEAGADRVFILHAVGAGVLLVPLSRYLAALRGAAAWVPLTAEAGTPAARQALMRYALLALGQAYDWWGVARFVLPWVQEARAKHFCSELAAAAYREAGLVTETWVSPQRLLEAPVFGAWQWL